MMDENKKTDMSSNFIRGGQVAFHNLTMAGQIISKSIQLAIFLSFIVYLLYFAYQCYQNPAMYDNAILYLSSLYNDDIILTNRYNYWLDYRTITNKHFNQANIFTLKFFILSLPTFFLIWGFYAKYKFKTRKNSGMELLTIKEANRILLKDSKELSKDKKVGIIKIGQLELPETFSSTHMLITGVTGAGKTNCLNTILSQIRAAGDKAIIVDSNCEFVKNFYDENKDFILNPLDKRSQKWNFWSEGKNQQLYKIIASSLIPDHKYSDPFWSNAAQTILMAIFEKEQLNHAHGIARIRKIITTFNDAQMKEYLKGTRGYQILAASDKTGGSILTTLTGWITDSLYLLEDSESEFSIKDFIQNKEDSFLFISTRTEDRSLLRNLMSAWVSIVVKQALTARNDNKKLWLIIDELSSLKKLPELAPMMAEGRKYNNCVITAFQNINQLFDTYGHNEAYNIVSNARTKLVFANSSHETNIWSAKELGNRNIHKMSESVSFGASSVRDGVNIQFQDKKELLIEPEEIEQLKNLECFVKLSKGLGVTKIKMDYLDLPSKADLYIPAEINQHENDTGDYMKDLEFSDVEYKEISSNKKKGKKTKDVSKEPTTFKIKPKKVKVEEEVMS